MNPPSLSDLGLFMAFSPLVVVFILWLAGWLPRKPREVRDFSLPQLALLLGLGFIGFVGSGIATYATLAAGS
ncbi:hypothetical protein LJR225_005157 [Phenylobacterium sp. LjRoot225]|uniref:hypothetical protein n=1 Tax=Phenylobacterium sp. LjRoot225 TaxID=3342285 RepID=UPI003ED155AD